MSVAIDAVGVDITGEKRQRAEARRRRRRRLAWRRYRVRCVLHTFAWVFTLVGAAQASQSVDLHLPLNANNEGNTSNGEDIFALIETREGAERWFSKIRWSPSKQAVSVSLPSGQGKRYRITLARLWKHSLCHISKRARPTFEREVKTCVDWLNAEPCATVIHTYHSTSGKARRNPSVHEEYGHQMPCTTADFEHGRWVLNPNIIKPFGLEAHAVYTPFNCHVDVQLFEFRSARVLFIGDSVLRGIFFGGHRLLGGKLHRERGYRSFTVGRNSFINVFGAGARTGLSPSPGKNKRFAEHVENSVKKHRLLDSADSASRTLVLSSVFHDFAEYNSAYGIPKGEPAIKTRPFEKFYNELKKMVNLLNTYCATKLTIVFLLLCPRLNLTNLAEEECSTYQPRKVEESSNPQAFRQCLRQDRIDCANRMAKLILSKVRCMKMVDLCPAFLSAPPEWFGDHIHTPVANGIAGGALGSQDNLNLAVWNVLSLVTRGL